MTEFDYQIIWLIATAVMTVTVLAFGTLKAADLLPSRTRTSAAAPAPTSSRDERPAARDERPEDHRHRHRQHAA